MSYYYRNNNASSNAVVLAALIAIGVSWHLYQRQGRHSAMDNNNGDDENHTTTATTISTGTYERMIGNTPLIKLERLSNQIGRSIYVKMENCNPGGTGKDRAALSMLQTAEQQGQLPNPIHMNSTSGGGSISSESSTMTRTFENNDNDNTNKDHASYTITPSNIPPLLSSSSSQTTSTSKRQREKEQIEDSIIQMAMARSKTGGIVVEGTSGSTGISLAQLCRSRGHACIVVMPDDQATEKQTILRTLGAIVHVVPNAAISNPNQYVNVAKRLAQRANNNKNNNNYSNNNNSHVQAVFINQFENRANYQVHYTTTGPEIWNALRHVGIDAFCMSSGTGGTIAGVSHYLKQQQQQQEQQQQERNNKNKHNNTTTRIVLIDPPGSALYHKVQHGVAYAPQQRERHMKRHRYDTLAEGIGLDRITQNFALAHIDEALQVSDQEAVDMAHYILDLEGLWIGSSSAMNLVGAVKTALSLPPQSTIVTVICDGGQRHVTRFWNRDFIVNEWGLQWPGDYEDGTSNDRDEPTMYNTHDDVDIEKNANGTHTSATNSTKPKIQRRIPDYLP